MDTMLTGVEDATAHLDGIIVVGQSKQDLIERANKVLIRIQHFGFQLRLEKCLFYLQAIKYMGFIFDRYCYRPDLANVLAIQRMQLPSDVRSLLSFLGLVSHYGSFLPLQHQIKAPLK